MDKFWLETEITFINIKTQTIVIILLNIIKVAFVFKEGSILLFSVKQGFEIRPDFLI